MRKTSVKRLKICARGHRFYKSSDCPVCPICWKGYYRREAQSDFPEKIGAPALRALQNAKIKNLRTLARWSENDVADLHGMGPKGIRLLKQALREQGLSFKKKLV